MDIEYKDTSHKNLCLCLFSEDVSVEHLNVLESKVYNNVEFGVLGASHFVKVRNDEGEVVLTEVFSCENTFEDSLNYDKYSCEENGYVELKKVTDSFSYYNEIIVQNYDGQFRNAISNRLRSYEIRPEKCARFKFPLESDSLPFEAWTTVEVDDGNESKTIRVDTMHSYPEEGKLVITKSIIRLR